MLEVGKIRLNDCPNSLIIFPDKYTTILSSPLFMYHFDVEFLARAAVSIAMCGRLPCVDGSLLARVYLTSMQCGRLRRAVNRIFLTCPLKPGKTTTSDIPACGNSSVVSKHANPLEFLLAPSIREVPWRQIAYSLGSAARHR